MSLSPDTMLEISKGYLVTHTLYDGIWVVVEREHDIIHCILANHPTCQAQLNWFVDDRHLKLFKV